MPPLLHWPEAAGAQRSVLDVLTESYELEPERVRVVTRSYIDTPDLRLRRRSVGLVHDQVGRTPSGSTLRISADGEETALPAPEVAWPAFPSALPERVASRVAKPASIRALLPACAARVRVQPYRVLDDEAKTVVRLEWEEPTLTEPARVPQPVRVRVRSVRGYDDDAKRVVELLVGAGFEVGETPEQEQAFAAAGVLDETEPAYGRLTADEPADVGVARALLGFLDAIERNVQGTVDDVDTEFLHDLRVAVRRTRTLLKLAGDVLPGGLARRYAPRFKWLGDLTTPNRDLDVYLLGYDDLVARLSVAEPVDLEPFAAHLEKRRASQRRSLVRGLRSARFTNLLDGWRDALWAVVEAEEREGGLTAAQLGADRIAHAHKRVVKRARKITPDSPSEDVHDLRKRCKELRYVVEVFAPAYDPKVAKRVLRDLKGVQDTLGDFQDGEVQRHALRTYAEEMVEAGTATAPCLLAMGELTTVYDAGMRRARDELGDQITGYLGGKTRQRLRRLTTRDRSVS